MKTLYIIRHGSTEIPKDKKRCIGLTDISLVNEGVREAEALRTWFADKKIAVIYTSPLSRCLKTARIIADEKIPIIEVKDLREISTGLWENMSFKEIRKKYPDAYAFRGDNLWENAPPEGESFCQGAKRFKWALNAIVNTKCENIVIVSHSGVVRSWLSLILTEGKSNIFSYPQPFGGITKVTVNNNKYTFDFIGLRPEKYPEARMCAYISNKYKMSKEVFDHSIAVANLAEVWAKKLNLKGCTIDISLLRSACLLHDIGRGDGVADHVKTGVSYICMEGYPLVAKIIEKHHWLDDTEIDKLNETTLLFLADKRVCKARQVTLEERFAESLSKCKNPQALKKHDLRKKQAFTLQANLEKIIGTTN